MGGGGGWDEKLTSGLYWFNSLSRDSISPRARTQEPTAVFRAGRISQATTDRMIW